MLNKIGFLTLFAFNSYNKRLFWEKFSCRTASNSDLLAETINTAIDFSNMNRYDKELYKAFCSSCNYIFNGVY